MPNTIMLKNEAAPKSGNTMLASSMYSATQHLSQMKPKNSFQSKDNNLKSLFDNNMFEDDYSECSPPRHLNQKTFAEFRKQISGEKFGLNLSNGQGQLDNLRTQDYLYNPFAVPKKEQLEKKNSLKIGVKRCLDR